ERTAEGLPDAADGLAQPVLVLDEREAHVVVAVFTEADARRHRHLPLPEQELRELDRSHRAIRLRNLCPHEHRRLRLRNVPPDALQPVAEHVAPYLIALGV